MISALLLALVITAPPLPNYTKDMTGQEFHDWATQRNAEASQAAGDRAVAGVGGYRIDTSSKTFGFMPQRRWFSGGSNRFSVNSSSRVTETYVPGSAGYGGGPLTVINPFCQPK
jgi:hypothetical protein